MVDPMHSRLSSSLQIGVFIAGALFGTPFTSTAADTSPLGPLQGSYELKLGANPVTYDLALNELMVLDQNKSGTLQTIAPQASADALGQLASTMVGGAVSEVRLVMYPRGYQRHEGSQIHISKRILAEVDPDTDPLSIATALGIFWKDSLSYMENYHVYEAASPADALRLLATMAAQPGVLNVRPDIGRVYEPLFVPNDPLFTNQWHLLNIGQQGAQPGADVNITNAWESYLGSNIVIGVFDAGFELTHPDLEPNMLTNAAFNVNDGSQNVLPVIGETDDFHGTAVAGVAAARGNNGIGLTGSAPLASIIPIKVDFATVLDSQIADGQIHSNDVIHIHNNSWGPTLAFLFKFSAIGPISNALHQGMTFGRRGKGTIYMYAAGNTGEQQDDVNYSELANTMHTIAVAALNDLGARANYSTPGAALVCSAPSGLETNPGGRVQGTSTTDQLGTNGYNNTFAFPLGDYTDRDYTANFNGTSSATPLASGVVALMLEANTNLTWRDVQEIIIRTARVNDTNNVDWATNAAGFHFNHEYGAGIINADGATALAATWTNLPLRTNVTAGAFNINEVITDTTPLTQTLSFTNTEFRVEHLQLRTDISHPLRGDLQITVTSPSGMRSILARSHGDFNPDFVWTFMSTRHWGEIAAGDWTVEVADQRFGANGIANSLELVLWGSISNATFASLTNPPSILNPPVNRTATKGSDVAFRVNAIGSGQLNYRWLFNGQALSGQNGQTLVLNDVGPLQEGIYHVRVDNQFGTVVSGGANLFVNAPPEVTAQPSSRMVNIGDNVTLSVAAVGNNPLTYQWRFNGALLTNETAMTLSLNNFQPANAGNYDVVVRNPLSSIISDIALVGANAPVVFSGVTPSMGGSAFMFNFSGNTGQTFRVDGSIDLQSWTTLNTIVLSNGTSSFSDGAASTFSNRYYRVVPLP